jgi:hypothetical protein
MGVSIAAVFIFCVSLVGCAQSQRRGMELKSYPEVPPVAMDADWFQGTKASSFELQYVKWINGAGSTNVHFQRWLVAKVACGINNGSLKDQYSEWLTGPGITNVQFQRWLASESKTSEGLDIYMVHIGFIFSCLLPASIHAIACLHFSWCQVKAALLSGSTSSFVSRKA